MQSDFDENFDYAQLTINDRNPVKRKLQQFRLTHSLRILLQEKKEFDGMILDYGAGSGELGKRILEIYPASTIVAYEPSKLMRRQAEENVKGLVNMNLIDSLKEKIPSKFDYIFCMEVLEHLPEQALRISLQEIKQLSDKATKIIIGVPNEIFLAALFKGFFRLTRRYGEVDARIPNIVKAFLGRPPTTRPVIIFDGLPYITRHMGFDHRKFRKILQEYFSVKQIYGSPLIKFPLYLNSEIYFLCSTR